MHRGQVTARMTASTACNPKHFAGFALSRYILCETPFLIVSISCDKVYEVAENLCIAQLGS